MFRFDFAPAQIIDRYGLLEKLAICAGISVLLVTVFASWSPVGLRPTTSAGVGLEHVAAFALLGSCWGYAFPGRAGRLLLVLILIAILLEAGQTMVPGRHGRLIDVATKIAGCGAGVVISQIARKLTPRRSI